MNNAFRQTTESTPKLFKPSIGDIAKGTRDTDPRVRRSALRDLAQHASVDGEVHPALCLCLYDTDIEVRRLAVRSIAENAPKHPEMVYELAAAVINERDMGTQILCCEALEAFCPQGAIALPALLHLLKIGQADQRVAAIKAIATLGPDAEMARPALIQALSDPDKRVSGYASESLCSMSTAA